jgi:hypothetical protein
VSAQEWAASAVIDAEPVMRAATVLATATKTFAAKAMSTVIDADQDFLLSLITQIFLPRLWNACQ